MNEKKPLGAAPPWGDNGPTSEEWTAFCQATLEASKKGYYDHAGAKILRIPDEEQMRRRLARHVRDAAKQGVALSLEAAEQVAKFLVSPAERSAGGQFKSPVVKAMQMGQVAALVHHCALRETPACALVAAAWTDDPDKPLDPSGLRRMLNQKEKIWKTAAFFTAGAFSFRPSEYPDVDFLLFPKEHVKRILSATTQKHPVKRIQEFFHVENQK